MDTQEPIREQLVARREVLLRQVRKIEADLRHETPLDKDSQERAVELENEEVLHALDEAGREELALIRAALDRIDRGQYGFCERCGEEIAAARLSALPFAKYCIDCVEETEA